MMRVVLLAVFLLTLQIGLVQATDQVINRVAAVVNADIITTYQLDKAVHELLAIQHGLSVDQLSSAEAARLTDEILDKLIEDKLLEQRIKSLGLRVTEQEINTAIEDVKISNNINQQQLEGALTAQGMTLEGYREQISTEILRYKLLAQEVSHRVAVTSSEVLNYFQENIDQFDIRTRLYVSRISFPLAAGANTLERAKAARSRLLAGEDFSRVVDSISAYATGDIMGELILGDLIKPLQEAMGDLNPGEISEPIELNQQLHLFIVTDRRSGEDVTFERARKSIEEQLKRQKTELRFEEWEQELRARAYIDKRI